MTIFFHDCKTAGNARGQKLYLKFFGQLENAKLLEQTILHLREPVELPQHEKIKNIL